MRVGCDAASRYLACRTLTHLFTSQDFAVGRERRVHGCWPMTAADVLNMKMVGNICITVARVIPPA